MDDAEDLVCALGLSSDICTATPGKPLELDILIDAPDGKADT